MAKAPTHYLADILSPWGPVEIKRMFGGLGAWRDGIFFALIADGIPNLKIIDSLWRVPDEVLEYPETLAAWAQTAFEIARSKPNIATTKVEAKANLTIEFKSLGRKHLPLLREIGIASPHVLR